MFFSIMENESPNFAKKPAVSIKIFYHVLNTGVARIAEASLGCQQDGCENLCGRGQKDVIQEQTKYYSYFSYLYRLIKTKSRVFT